MTIDEAIKHAEEVAEEKENEGKLLCQSEGASIGCLTCAEEHRQLAEWLKDYKRLLEQEPKWIPVSERLPEEKMAVLVWCPEYKNIYCAYLEKKQWWIFGAFVQIVPNEVVAWMPLPPCYEPQERSE